MTRGHLANQDGLALSAYHSAYQALISGPFLMSFLDISQVQVGAKSVRSLLTPQLLADMAQVMDSSPAGYPMKIQVYEAPT